MKFKDYVQDMLMLLHTHPQAGEAEVIYSSDEEGNGYQKVVYNPSIGNFSEGYTGYFIGVNEFADFKLNKEKDINAVCIN